MSKREVEIIIRGPQGEGKTTMAALLTRVINGQTLHNVSIEKHPDMSESEWEAVVHGAQSFEKWIETVEHVSMLIKTEQT